MSEHTRGPWTVEESDDSLLVYGPFNEKGRAKTVMSYEEGKLVFYNDADKAVMFSAPQLLSVLEDCEMWLAGLQGTDYDSEGAVTAQLDEIRTAIAKARGEE